MFILYKMIKNVQCSCCSVFHIANDQNILVVKAMCLSILCLFIFYFLFHNLFLFNFLLYFFIIKYFVVIRKYFCSQNNFS